jgi:hypothetical protein
MTEKSNGAKGHPDGKTLENTHRAPRSPLLFPLQAMFWSFSTRARRPWRFVANKFAFYTLRSMINMASAKPATDKLNIGFLILGGAAPEQLFHRF